MELYDLMLQCTKIPYLQTGIAANYAVKRENEILYVFFEDSDGKTDWKDNLNFPAKAYKRMGRTVWFAHRGFLRVWKELEPVLAPDILDESVLLSLTAPPSSPVATPIMKNGTPF